MEYTRKLLARQYIGQRREVLQLLAAATSAGLQDSPLSWVEQFSSLRFEGLMTMAPDWGAEQSRPIFRTLRKLMLSIRDRLTGASSERFRHLSMGMSGDWEVAAEEGATLLRIGTALFRGAEENS